MLLRCAARAGTSILRGSRASLLPRAPLRPLCQAPHLDPVVPSPDRMLPAVVRTKLGGNATALLSTKQPDRVPAMLQGDWLPNVPVTVDRAALMVFLRRVHFQRELLTLDVEGGETVRVLVQQVQYDNRKHFNIKHVNFRRWPRDPTRNPVKLKVPIVAINGDSVPRVKLGGYVHDIFPRGLPCLVSDAEHVPRFFVVDMRRAVGDDFRMEQLELPPGVTVRQTPEVKSQQGLVARAKRVKN